MEALVQLLVGHDDARRWTAFIARETSDPEPAHEVLYRQLWAPGAELTARRIAALRGAARPRSDDRVQAVLLIGSVMAFQSGSSVSRCLLGRGEVGPAQQRLIAEVLRRRIALLAAAPG